MTLFNPGRPSFRVISVPGRSLTDENNNASVARGPSLEKVGFPIETTPFATDSHSYSNELISAPISYS